MANKNITIDDKVLEEILEWAGRPEENRTLSNAIETLCRRALLAAKEPKEGKE